MATSVRPKPKKILSSGEKCWEDLLYVQDEKTTEWHPRHVYLARYERTVYLMVYTTKPAAGKSKKPSEYWTLHSVVDGMAPRGFSKGGEASNSDMLTLGLQTKNPEGHHFVGHKNRNDLETFRFKILEALDFTPSQLSRPKNASLPTRTRPPTHHVVLPARSKSAHPYTVTTKSQRPMDNDSLGHLGDDSKLSSAATSEADEQPAYMALEGPIFEGQETNNYNQPGKSRVGTQTTPSSLPPGGPRDDVTLASQQIYDSKVYKNQNYYS